MKKTSAKQSLASLLVLTSLVSGALSGVATYASISLAEDSPPSSSSTNAGSDEEARRREEELKIQEELRHHEESRTLEEKRLDEQRKKELQWKIEDELHREKERLEGVTTGRDLRIECYTLNRETKTAEKVKCTDPECNLGFCRKEEHAPKELLQREFEEKMKLLEEQKKIPQPVRDAAEGYFTSTREPLGCFTPERMWTMERSACDPDQSRHFMMKNSISNDIAPTTADPTTAPAAMPSVQEPTEAELELQARMYEKFMHAEKRRGQQEQLRTMITEAIARLEKIEEKENLPEEISVYIGETVEWLRRIETDQAIDDTSPDEILAAAKEVSLSAREVAEVLKETGWKEPVKEEKRQGIVTIAGKIERILSKIPQVLAIFEVTPGGAQAAYEKARASFSEASAACEADLNTCKNFASTLDALEELKGVIDNAITISGNTLLREKIESLLRNP